MTYFVTPAAVSAKINLSAEIQQMWKQAVWTVKQAQKRFLAAYKATINEQLPDWEKTWQTDPNFHAKLGEIEKYMSLLCRSNGMPLTVFNRYRTAARKCLLTGLPFQFATSNYTVAEAKAIREGGEEAAKAIKERKNLKHAENVMTKKATVLPLPAEGENVVDYVEVVSERLLGHLRAIKERLGEEAYQQVLAKVTGS